MMTKGPGRTLAEQVADWTDQATHVLGRRGPEVTDHDIKRFVGCYRDLDG